jgi:hypothetical protein
LVTWQRPRPFARDLRESHKKAGFSVALENNPSLIFNQLSFCTLHTVYALLFTLLILLFCCQVTFCALVYFMWVFVLSQFPSHTIWVSYIVLNLNPIVRAILYIPLMYQHLERNFFAFMQLGYCFPSHCFQRNLHKHTVSFLANS